MRKKVNICAWMIGALVLAAGGLRADVVWDDSFDGASLNGNLTVNAAGDGTVTQTGGQLRMSISSGSSWHRARVKTAKGQNGETQFEGADLYDFTAHEVAVRFDIASFTGDPSTSVANQFNVFSTGIGVLNASGAVDNGVKVDLAKRWSTTTSSAYYRMELAGFGASVNQNIDGVPTAIQYVLDGNSMSLTLEGALFTSSSSATYDWTFNSGTAASYELMFGALNNGAPLTGTEVVLNSFQVEVIPEPATVGLFIFSSAGLLLYRRIM